MPPYHDDEKSSNGGSGDSSVCANDDEVEAATARWTMLASEAGEVQTTIIVSDVLWIIYRYLLHVCESHQSKLQLWQLYFFKIIGLISNCALFFFTPLLPNATGQRDGQRCHSHGSRALRIRL